MNKLSLLVGLLVLTMGSLACAARDLSTDDGVLNALNVDRKSDSKLQKDDICVQRPESMKGIILVGYFAHDRGCMPGDVFVKGKRFKFAAATGPVLAALGWSKAKGDARTALAKSWTIDGLMEFEGSVLSSKPESFNKDGFHPPEVKVLQSGEIQVALWARGPTGMRCGDSYRRMLYSYPSTGTGVTHQRTDGFFVPCAD